MSSIFNFRDPNQRKNKLYRKEYLSRPPGGGKPKPIYSSLYRENEDNKPCMLIYDPSNVLVGKIFPTKTPDLRFKLYMVDGFVRGAPFLDFTEAVWKVFELHHNKEKLKAYLRKTGKLKD